MKNFKKAIKVFILINWITFIQSFCVSNQSCECRNKSKYITLICRLVEENEAKFLEFNFSIYSFFDEISIRNKNYPILDNNLFWNVTIRSIELTYNQISYISNETFNGIFGLQKLNLKNNKIKTIENILKSLESNYKHDTEPVFKYLDLSFNYIQKIDIKLSNYFKNLEELILKNNKIYFLKEDIFLNCKNLKFLDLTSNRLITIENFTFKYLDNLNLLFLGNNQIKSIEFNSFNNLTNLKILKLEYNKLDFISKYLFRNLKNLESLSLSNNRIKIIEYKMYANQLKLKNF